MESFKRDLVSLLNRFSMENGSNTPDFILAEFLNSCLTTLDTAIKSRGPGLSWQPEQRQRYVREMIAAASTAMRQRDDWYEPEALH